MKKVLNWFTQKKTFVISIVGVCGFYLFLNLHRSGVCVPVNTYSSETNCEYIAVLSLIFWGTLFFSGIFLLIKNQLAFGVWKKFTFIYLFIYLFIVMITPWYEGDGFLSIQKDLVALWLVGLYVIISISVILSNLVKKNP